MKKIVWLLVVVFCFSIASVAYAKNLHKRFEHKDIISLYLNDVTDSTGANIVTPKMYREIFTEVLSGRKEIRFNAVNSPEQADAIVDVNIKSYVFDAEVNPSIMGGRMGLVADTLVPKNRCKIKASYVVRNPRTNTLMMKKPYVFAQERMPREKFNEKQTAKATVEKNVETFLIKMFYPEKKLRL
jgi:hypothetical protein